MIEKCPKCGAPMLIYRSFNFKQCVDCSFKIDFFLKEGQLPLIKHQR